jgi:hypothetical protein
MRDYHPRQSLTRADKLYEAHTAIKDAGFTSLNQFLIEFYSSKSPQIADLARRSLQYRDDQHETFLPRRIIPLWENICAGKAEDQLRLSLTEQVAIFVKDEFNRAIRLDDLRLQLSDTRLAAGLSLLSKLYVIYRRALPCFCLILSTTLLASNYYELAKKTTKQGKNALAIRVRAHNFFAHSSY